ncbi:MAG: 16S rRNA (cytosine(1402)-N(4))-methyltransferase RsmH [Fimbriimonadaceae bacterium]|nr:16S rRNA (cytosine(1402)-N(4))-methyltransferase RsmH [Fimbriimonadaceae bacterium]
MNAAPTHVPVMTAEVMAAMDLRPGDVYIDGTLGLAGHARLAARRIAPGGMVLGLDWDQEMLARARAVLADLQEVHVATVHASFHDLETCGKDALTAHGRAKASAGGILFDLGVSNVHLSEADRGFSFRNEAPLDMRMDRTSRESAAAWLNRATPAEIEDVLWSYGDERWARRIAQVIVARRPLHTTTDLAECVLAAIPAAKRDARIHPATRSFQAVRCHVNDELEPLGGAILHAAHFLRPGGTLVVLSYHSGEDRRVKLAMKQAAAEGDFEILYKKPLEPDQAEVALNPKARSARLRALRRTSQS